MQVKEGQFVEYVVALRWYLDPANRPEAIDILARFLKQPPARFEGWVFSKNDFYRNPDGLVNLDALQNNIDLMRQLGIISTDLNAASHASLDLVIVTTSSSTVAEDRRSHRRNGVDLVEFLVVEPIAATN